MGEGVAEEGLDVVEDEEVQLAGEGKEELEEEERGSAIGRMIQGTAEESSEKGEEELEEVERGSVLGRMIQGTEEKSPEKGEEWSEEWAR